MPRHGSSSSTHKSSSSSSSSHITPTTERARAKSARIAHIREIDSILSTHPIDLTRLRELSLYGFEDDARRRVIWPLMLGVEVDGGEGAKTKEATAASSHSTAGSSSSAIVSPASSSSTSTSPHSRYDYTLGLDLTHHKYYDQVCKDIARSMFHFDVTQQFKERKREESRLALGRIIHTLFTRHDELHYIQGFHDIASVFLLVLHDPSSHHSSYSNETNARGEMMAYLCIEQLSLRHIRDSLRPSLDTVIEVLSLIFPLLEQTDSEVFEFLKSTNVQSFFTLSWILTWFSHNLYKYSEISRVFDFFLSHHPLIPLYTTVALICELRTGLLDLKRVGKEKRRKERRERNQNGNRNGNGNGVHHRNGSSASSSSNNHKNNSHPHPDSSDDEDEDAPVDLSAVHEYFQNLPPYINLDSLFKRTLELEKSFPPMMLIRKEKLNIPEDSPLRNDSEKMRNNDAHSHLMHYISSYLKQHPRLDAFQQRVSRSLKRVSNSPSGVIVSRSIKRIRGVLRIGQSEEQKGNVKRLVGKMNSNAASSTTSSSTSRRPTSSSRASTAAAWWWWIRRRMRAFPATSMILGFLLLLVCMACYAIKK